MSYETKHEGHGYDFGICVSHVSDEPREFSEYFLLCHSQDDSSDQLSLTAYVFVSLADSYCGCIVNVLHFMANINTHDFIFHHNS